MLSFFFTKIGNFCYVPLLIFLLCFFPVLLLLESSSCETMLCNPFCVTQIPHPPLPLPQFLYHFATPIPSSLPKLYIYLSFFSSTMTSHPENQHLQLQCHSFHILIAQISTSSGSKLDENYIETLAFTLTTSNFVV